MLQPEKGSESALDNDSCLDSSVEIGLEKAISVFNLAFKLLSLFSNHPALDSLLFFDFSCLFLCSELLDEQAFVALTLLVAFPMRLNDRGRAGFVALDHVFSTAVIIMPPTDYPTQLELGDAPASQPHLVFLVDDLRGQGWIKLAQYLKRSLLSVALLPLKEVECALLLLLLLRRGRGQLSPSIAATDSSRHLW